MTDAEHTSPTAEELAERELDKFLSDSSDWCQFAAEMAQAVVSALRAAGLLPSATPRAGQVFSPESEPIALTPEQRAAIDLMNAHPEITGAQWAALAGTAGGDSTDELIEQLLTEHASIDISDLDDGVTVGTGYASFRGETPRAALLAAVAPARPKEG